MRSYHDSMKGILIIGLALLILAGCASPPVPSVEPMTEAGLGEEAPTPAQEAAPMKTSPVVSAPETVSSAVEPPGFAEVSPEVEPQLGADDLPVPSAGEYAIRVESEPSGAMVVVDGRPVGPAPCIIRFPGTNRGFFRNDVSIRVRFIAADATEVSSTIEEVFTALDRIPPRVVFSTAGAKRIW